MLIPSDDLPDAATALRSLLADGARVRAAVAFVTRGGVAVLDEILGGREGLTLEVVARAADITEPEALFALRDQLGADVSVVIGRHARTFHPKLWLVETGDELAVLAGSGNLTEGGMADNAEQFDVRRMPTTGEAAAAELDRFERLTGQAQSLDQIVDTAIWREWESVIKKQRQLRLQLTRAERDFLAREPMPDRAVHKAQLIEDLQKIYDDAVAANLKRRDGQQYYPTRLLVAINRSRAGERDPVNLVTDTIRRRTEGLDILLEAGLVELTLEWLVLDESKPYHDLFVERSREIARLRVAEFRERAAAPRPEDA